jgi:hypothetical protein
MAYTVDQIIKDFRSDVFDIADVDDAGVARDALWSDAEALRYLNSACARLASDTLALRRQYSFDIEVGDPLVRFPYTEILDGLQVSFSVPSYGRRRQLREFDLQTGIAVDDYGLVSFDVPDLAATGMPSHYTRDYDEDFMRLWPVPAVAGTLSAYATVLPVGLVPGMSLPFPAVQDRDLLLMWMKKLAYAKQDADTLDLKRSESFEAEYMRFMPDRRSEVDRVRRNGGLLQAS